MKETQFNYNQVSNLSPNLQKAQGIEEHVRWHRKKHQPDVDKRPGSLKDK